MFARIRRGTHILVEGSVLQVFSQKLSISWQIRYAFANDFLMSL